MLNNFYSCGCPTCTCNFRKDFFTKDPVKAVEKVLGVDLPDEMIEKIVAGVKAKLTAEQIAGAASFLILILNKTVHLYLLRYAII